jgi:hypothetical protein
MPMDGDSRYAWDVDVSAVQREGFVCRPVAETVADTWAWMQAGEVAPVREGLPRHGIDPDKEERVLTTWDARR